MSSSDTINRGTNSQDVRDLAAANPQATLYRKDADGTQALACVMVSYFTGEVLFTSIAAVLEQSSAPAELLIVDNGNPPNVRARLDELEANTANLRVVRGQGNVGFAAGCNLGCSQSESPYLLFLNPDCVLPDGSLERLHIEHAQLPPRSMLSPLLLNTDYTEQRGSRRTVLTPWRAVVEWLGLYRLAPSHPYFLRFNRTGEPLPFATHRVDVTSGAAMLLARSLFEELRGFDEGYFLHVEDIDLCVTLLKRGGATYVAPAVRVIHQGASSRAPLWRIEWHKARGFCRYFRKHFTGVYPRGFVSVVNLLVWMRLLLRLPLLLVRHEKQSRASVEDIDRGSIASSDRGD